MSNSLQENIIDDALRAANEGYIQRHIIQNYGIEYFLAVQKIEKLLIHITPREKIQIYNMLEEILIQNQTGPNLSFLLRTHDWAMKEILIAMFLHETPNIGTQNKHVPGRIQTAEYCWHLYFGRPVNDGINYLIMGITQEFGRGNLIFKKIAREPEPIEDTMEELNNALLEPEVEIVEDIDRVRQPRRRLMRPEQRTVINSISPIPLEEQSDDDLPQYTVRPPGSRRGALRFGEVESDFSNPPEALQPSGSTGIHRIERDYTQTYVPTYETFIRGIFLNNASPAEINKKLIVSKNPDKEFISKPFDEKNTIPKLCLACSHNKPDFVTIPCGHFTYCGDCQLQIQDNNNRCPMCKEENIKFLQIFM